MTDRIELRGLRVMAVHGMLAEERTRAQPFELDLDVELDLAAAGSRDDLGLSVDYGRLVRLACEALGEPAADLMEHLAERTARAVLAAEPSVQAVTVGVRKLHPPVAADLASAGVRIRRARDHG